MRTVCRPIAPALVALAISLAVGFGVAGLTHAASGPEEKPALFKKVYAAADLVVPFSPAKSAKPSFGPLQKLIMSTIDPDSWEDAGGNGTIELFPKNLSVVIAQTAANHERIAQLFEQLRGEENRQIVLETRLITSPGAVDLGTTLPSPGKPKLLHAKRMKALVDAAQSDRQTSLWQAPKVTVFPGQVAQVSLTQEPDEIDLLAHATLADEPHWIRLTLAVNAKNAIDALASSISVMVPEGSGVVVDITERLAATDDEQTIVSMLASAHRISFGNPPAKRILLLITPRMIEQPAERPPESPATP